MSTRVDTVATADTAWPDLTPVQADGLACVACGCDYLTARVPQVPVGRSGIGSQVFACTGTCVANLTAVAR